MEQADSTTVPISFAPAVPSHAILLSSNNHFEDSVDHGDKITIVCALAAPNNTDGPFIAKRKQRTFWTACASCNKKSKHSIEHLDCDISCPQCSKTFKATEVSRPRKNPTATAENVHSRSIITSPGTKVEPSKLKPAVETPLPKRVKRDINVTQAAGKYGDNLPGINAIIKNVHSRAIVTSPGTMVEPSKMTPAVETPLPKRVKRDMNATQAAGTYGGNIQGINAISKEEIKRLLKSKGWNMVIEARINGNNVGQ